MNGLTGLTSKLFLASNPLATNEFY